MKKNTGMRPQDVVILLKKTTPSGRLLNGKQLADELGISASEISEAMDRNLIAGLVDNKKKRVNTLALKDFLVYGIRFCFPVVLGGIVRGVPTAVSAPQFTDLLASTNDVYVWPSANGSGRGQAIEPLYHSVPEAAIKDPAFYKLLSLVEVLRMGRAREKEIAIQLLTKHFEEYARQ